MKLKVLLMMLLVAVTFTSYAQVGGIRGKVVSRNGRVALSNVQVKIESLGREAVTDNDGNFLFENLPAGNYTMLFSTPEFEELALVVRVGDQFVQDLKSVIIVPNGQTGVLDDAVFSEFDSDSSSSDTQALPSSLSSSKDIFNSIASYRFSEMRFNVRGYDSQYSDTYLNGIRFNDAMTGYGPWSLWSGLNDATRNQENYTGLQTSDFGIGGIGGMTNINARASQMRKGLRVSLSNGNQMYRFRAMVSYASGQLDNGWSYGFSVGTRQGGNGYVDGVYYNSYSYFASVEKLFGQNHRLGLTVLASPSERGAQQAATDEAYRLFGNNYYNPNVGYQAGKLRNSRVRNTHEPIVMLNYTWDMSENTRLNAATSLRFGKNGYSALTWNGGSDPRGDYYRFMPLSDQTQIVPGITTDETIYFYGQDAVQSALAWTGMIDYDNLFGRNHYIDTDPELVKLVGDQYRSNYMIEERHTDQLDYNFAVNVEHNMRHNMRIIGGANLRVNRTDYFSEVKDLMGGDYWYDIDKFAERDMASVSSAQNDLDYYWATGHARVAREGDKFGYFYRAHLLETNAWANYTWRAGGFSLGVAGSVGYTNMYREGMWRKGLFPNNSKGDSKKLDYLTYEGKLSLGYKFSGAHALEAGVVYMQKAPKFSTAFVSPRTRNTTTPGLDTEKVFGADLTYNLNLPFVKARLSGYYTTIEDESRVISFYDDTRSSFTNFAMSGIDKRHYGMELALSVPVWNGLSVVGALSWGKFTYTSNPDFVQTVDNVDKIVLKDKVNWDGYRVERSPQMAFNIGLDFRGPRSWFAGVNFNYYDDNYLSMNPMYRTNKAVQYYTNVLNSQLATNEQKVAAIHSIKKIRSQEKFDSAYTLSANVGKNWYIHHTYTIGFSLEVKNILNDQNIRTGGYEQMRMSKVRGEGGEQIYGRFPSKYFYLFGTTYYLNVYFRF